MPCLYVCQCSPSGLGQSLVPQKFNCLEESKSKDVLLKLLNPQKNMLIHEVKTGKSLYLELGGFDKTLYICLFLSSFYLWYLQVYNKVDQISIEEVDRLARRSNSAVIRSDLYTCVSSYSFYVCMYVRGSSTASSIFCIFQLWDEVEPGLPSGDVVGIPLSDLHLYKEKRRYAHISSFSH